MKRILNHHMRLRRIRRRSRKMSGLLPCKEGAYLNKGNETASVPFRQHLEIVSNFNFLEIPIDVFDEVLIYYMLHN